MTVTRWRWAFALVIAVPTTLVAQGPPAGATAQCRDGSYSFSASRRGTCSHHGGVARWLSPTAQVRAPSSDSTGATQHRTLTASQAKDHVGETATVCGVVASARYAASSRGRATFLNLDQPYPNQVFTVLIWGSARSAFPAPPETEYRAKRICVTGTISAYRRTPEMVASSPQAIVVQDRP